MRLGNTMAMLTHTLLCLLVTAAVQAGVPREKVWQVSATEGEDVDIKCYYPLGYQQTGKYFCRAPCWEEDVLIRSGEVFEGWRYSLHDNRLIRRPYFTVKIKNVTRKDSGIYFYGLDQSGRDPLYKVSLNIHPIPVAAVFPGITKVSATEGQDMEIKCPYPDGDQNSPKIFFRLPLDQGSLTRSSMQISDIRYFLHDNPSALNFIVTIRKVTPMDGGIYMCGPFPDDLNWSDDNTLSPDEENYLNNVMRLFELKIKKTSKPASTSDRSLTDHEVQTMSPEEFATAVNIFGDGAGFL